MASTVAFRPCHIRERWQIIVRICSGSRRKKTSVIILGNVIPIPMDQLPYRVADGIEAAVGSGR